MDGLFPYDRRRASALVVDYLAPSKEDVVGKLKVVLSSIRGKVCSRCCHVFRVTCIKDGEGTVTLDERAHELNSKPVCADCVGGPYKVSRKMTGPLTTWTQRTSWDFVHKEVIHYCCILDPGGVIVGRRDCSGASLHL